MLGEAHRRLERGTDVVAAVVETHGRKKTAELLEGIEVVPPRYIDYRGEQLPRTRRRRGAGAPAPGGAGRRTRPHQHPGQQEPQALAGRRGAARRRASRSSRRSTCSTWRASTTSSPRSPASSSRRRCPTRSCAPPTRSNWSTSRRKRCGAGLSHGNVYAPERVDAALSNYFRRGNLTALRELALLWLADQVDAALAKYRAENKITDTWEARERVVVAVTGGPESETLVRRASRIASKSSAELMVVHVVRGDGLSGVSAPQMGKVRELATSLGATLHTVVGDDVPAALLDFAREMNATQLVLGTSRRSRWARIFDEGIGAADRAALRQDRRAHGHPRGSQAGARVWRRSRPGSDTSVSWLAALVVPSAICAVTVLSARPVPRHRRRERAVLRRRAGRRPARRRCAGGAVGGALRAAAQLLPGRARATPSPSPNPTAPSPIVVLLARRGRGRRPGRRRGQPRPRGPARVAGGRTAGAVRRIGAARRRSGHAAGAGPRDLLAARRSACCGKARGDRRRAWARIPASTSTPPTPRSRSATTSSGC